jgi:hypothetical protein
MITILAEQTPQLAPPGGGLPFYELMVARVLVGWRARRTTRAQAAAVFAAERRAILRLIERAGPDAAARRVLIPRPRGLEDSSRSWSAYMVLDHLRIVNDATATLIGQLVRDERPDRVVSTADVKPSPSADASVVPAFERCATASKALLPPPATSVRA